MNPHLIHNNNNNNNNNKDKRANKELAGGARTTAELCKVWVPLHKTVFL